MTPKKRLAKARSPLPCANLEVSGAPPSRNDTPSLEKPAGSTSAIFLVAQMIFCLIGINLCFGWWSVKQERVIKKPYAVLVGSAESRDGDDTVRPAHETVFLSTVYGMTLMQTLTGFLLSAMLLSIHHVVRRITQHQPTDSAHTISSPNGRTRRRSQARLSLQDVPEFLAMGLANISSSSLGYAAMRRLSYPVTLTAKMAKMLPVILVGSVWYHTRYPARKVVSCFLITGGVIVFALLDQHSTSGGKTAKTRDRPATPSSALLGAVLLIGNLLMDGYTNSTQDVLVKRYRWSGVSLMMWTNFVSVVCALFVLTVLEFGEQPWVWLCSFVDLVLSSLSRSSDQVRLQTTSAGLALVPFHDLSNFVLFLMRCDEARNDVLLMSVLNATGQLFIFHTISLFGTLALSAMTLLRKTGCVLLSIYMHGHHVQPLQWAALTTVFTGIVSEGYINVQEALERQKQRSALPPQAANTNGLPDSSSSATQRRGERR
ncbi:hypothetical protein ABL78_1470 [Leptomonas seymouri]|uniref:UDP-galactose transporter n=1 Tax=Leptomonas seymouri TaxID=5684 RepID=A0A0N1I7F6_LEPSE|nr:hypothetical protein ABL78_1470 [Leptomonas seymouri]|eukprot:KPI89434.1 hypothetical protein ABL78_1470 [Leptomonas seymouri]